MQESANHRVADLRFFHRSPTHDEAIARLHFLIERGRQLGLLLGPTGSGKTLVLDILGRELADAGCQVVRMNLLASDSRQFLWELALQLRQKPTSQSTLLQLWRAIVDRLAENKYQQLPTVLLLDDADEADDEVLSQVVRLLHHGASPESRLTVVLAADRQSVRKLGHRIVDLSELRIELEAWDPEEILRFLESLVARAGVGDTIFDHDVAARLHELSGGTPRRVVSLVELALAAGEGENLPLIDTHTIDAVYQELSVAR